MPKPSFDDELKNLRAIARGEITDEAVEYLRGALNSSQSTLAALAAEVAANRHITDLVPDLASAFDRFMAGTDKGYQAKTAIVKALIRLEEDAVCVRGIKQIEMDLAGFLLDPHANPRRAAIKALAHMETESAEKVIRLKALIGDTEPEVMSECFTALMSLSPQTSLSFIGRFLDSPDPAVAEQAALTLGRSHEAEAFGFLREAWDNNLNPDFRRMLLLAISLLRRDEAFEFLIDLVETGSPKLADAVMSALAVYADDNGKRKIRDAVKRRDDQPIADAYTRQFGDD